MSAPIDLSAERERRSQEYDGARCECGNAWFDAQVVINRDGCVTGYVSPPTCTECKRPLYDPARRRTPRSPA